MPRGLCTPPGHGKSEWRLRSSSGPPFGVLPEKGFRRCCSVKTVFLARFMQRKNARGEPATFLAVPPIWGCAASSGAGFTDFLGKARTLKGESMSLETYQNMMAELGRACGFSLPVDDTGYTSLEVDGSLICNIQYIDPADAAYIYFEIGRIVAGGEGKVAPERCWPAVLFWAGHRRRRARHGAGITEGYVQLSMRVD